MKLHTSLIFSCCESTSLRELSIVRKISGVGFQVVDVKLQAKHIVMSFSVQLAVGR